VAIAALALVSGVALSAVHVPGLTGQSGTHVPTPTAIGAPAPAEAVIGVNVDLMQYDAPSLAKVVERLASAGIGYVRQPVPWAAIEPEAGRYAWDRLETMGALLAEGSDYYSAPGPALAGLHAAWTRQNAVGMRGGGPAGRLVAFRMHTTFYPSDGGPPTPGWLAPDRPADLVILSANPLSVGEPDVLRIAVLATIRAGRVTYDGGLTDGVPPGTSR